MKKINIKFPKVGQRIIKSVVGVALSFAVYFLRGQNGIPFYTAIAVLQCIQPYRESTGKMAKQRIIGTFIGAFWGLVVVIISNRLPEILLVETMWKYLFIAIMAGFVIYCAVLLNQSNAAYFSSVVFLSITVNHIADANPFLFVMNRVIDTLIGVGLAIILNLVRIPKKKNKRTLFVAGIDGVMLNETESVTPYSRVELNRMIADGVKFTVATMRTPASAMDALEGINLNLPIITMNGAALYDINKNTYLNTYTMKYAQALKIMSFLSAYKVSYFTNTIINNVHTIYYSDLTNEPEKDIYNSMIKSPYRNYVKSNLPADTGVSYIMTIQKSEIIRHIDQDMKAQGYYTQFRVLTYPAAKYPGYTFLKIFNKEATRENMLHTLQALLNAEEIVTFGTMNYENNVRLERSDGSGLIKELKHMYNQIK